MVVWWNGIVPSGCHFLTCDDKQGLWRSILTYTDVGVGRGAHLWPCCPRLCLLSLSAHRSVGVDILKVVFSQIWCHLSVLSGVLLLQTLLKSLQSLWMMCSFLPHSETGQGATKEASGLALFESCVVILSWMPTLGARHVSETLRFIPKDKCTVQRERLLFFSNGC